MSEAEQTFPAVSITVPRVMIVGSSAGVGVTSVTLGLVAALKKRKVSIGVASVGTDLVQATHYRRVTGTLVHSLDLWMLSREQVRESVARLSSGAEMLVIEGNKGIFDLYPPDSSVTNEAEFANLLKMPVILVLDAHGYRESLAATVQGFTNLYAGVQIAGVIANRVSSDDHAKRIAEAVARLQGPAFLGAIPEDEALRRESQTQDKDSNPSLLSRRHVVAASDLVEKHLNIEAIKRIASEARGYDVRKTVLSSKSRACKIAIADDMAFHLTFQSNLDLLRREGAELVAFSPLVDRKLPAGIRGIYLPGGFPHLYASELSANTTMLQLIRQFVADGGVLFAEGNSIAYLCRSAALSSGTSLTMAGILPANAALLTERTSDADLSAVEVRSHDPTVITRRGELFRGYRDYHWAIRPEEKIQTSFELYTRGDDREDSSTIAIQEGFAPLPHVLITSVISHWGSNPVLARVFVESVLKGKREGLPAEMKGHDS